MKTFKMQPKTGRPPISPGDLTLKKSITLRASTWAKIEAERQGRESTSACLDRIASITLELVKVEFWGDKNETGVFTRGKWYLIQSPGMAGEYEELSGKPKSWKKLPQSVCGDIKVPKDLL